MHASASEPPPDRLAGRPKAFGPRDGSEGQVLRLRALALPVEHGGWGMLGEPLALGLLVAPSWAGLGVAAAALFAFLARHPAKIAAADWRARRRVPRTPVAEALALAYAGAAACGAWLASSGAPSWWWPLAAAAPLALVQFAHDARNQGRQLLPELVGGAALGSVAAAVLLASGWSAGAALAAWALVALKNTSAIAYVRARLRLDRGLPVSRAAVVACHAVAVAVALGLAWRGLGPWLAAAAFGVLLVRAALGLSRFRRRVPPRAVGIMELAWGVAFVLVLAVGYAAGL